MASSLQKDNLAKDVKEVLGISNVDFSEYNYKPNKAVQKVIDLITENLRSVDINVVKDGSVTLLTSLKFVGCYDTLTKPNIKTLYSISATEWYPTEIELLIGSHHAGFDGLVVAAEVIRHASKNNLSTKRVVKDISSAKRVVENAINHGAVLMLNDWNYHERGYIYRQCGVSEVDLDTFVNYEDKSIKVSVVEQCLVVDLVGVRNINSSFKLRFIDDEVAGFDLHECDAKALSLFKAWLVVRGKNVQDLYRNALFEQKRDAIKEHLANGNGTMDVVRQMVIISSQIACGKIETPTELYKQLDTLAEEYLKIRNEHK